MKILVRYVLAELFKIFFLAVTVLTFFLVAIMGVREALRSGLPLGLTLGILPYFLPEVLGITIPICVLLAVVTFFSRFSATREYLAVLAVGIQPKVLIWPVLTWATAISLVTVGCYEGSARWGRPQMREMILQAIPRIVLARLEMDKSLWMPSFSLVVREVRGNLLQHAVITIPARGDHPQVTITAETVELKRDPTSGNLVLRCFNGDLEVADKGRVQFSDWMEHMISLEGQTRPLRREWLAMHEIPGAVKRIREELARVMGHMVRLPEGSTELAKLQRQRHELELQLRRLATEPVRRWANGFACLCFTLVGIGVAIRSRSENVLTNFFLCFTPISALYYPLLTVGEQFTALGYLPPIGFWIANLCMVVPGVWLLWTAPA
jgi:lipopolysaccharide export system permease protein